MNSQHLTKELLKRVILGYLSKFSSKFVYRLGSSYIKDFSEALLEYHHNDGWSVSGRYDMGEDIPSGYQSDRGLFAAKTLEEVAPYAIPRGVNCVLGCLIAIRNQ